MQSSDEGLFPSPALYLRSENITTNSSSWFAGYLTESLVFGRVRTSHASRRRMRCLSTRARVALGSVNVAPLCLLQINRPVAAHIFGEKYRP